MIEDVAGGVLKFIGRLVLEVIFEGLIQGTGYLLCRPFSKKLSPDSWIVVFVGCAFWVVVGLVIYNAMYSCDSTARV